MKFAWSHPLSKKNAFYDDNFVIFLANHDKTWNMGRHQPKLESVKLLNAWMTTGDAWLILVKKVAFSGNKFVTFGPIFMKLEIYVDISNNLNL